MVHWNRYPRQVHMGEYVSVWWKRKLLNPIVISLAAMTPCCNYILLSLYEHGTAMILLSLYLCRFDIKSFVYVVCWFPHPSGAGAYKTCCSPCVCCSGPTHKTRWVFWKSSYPVSLNKSCEAPDSSGEHVTKPYVIQLQTNPEHQSQKAGSWRI